MFHVGVSAMEMEIWFLLLMIGIQPCCQCTWRHIIGTMVWCPSLDPFSLSIISLTRFVLSAKIIHLMWSFIVKKESGNWYFCFVLNWNKELMSKCIHIFTSILCFDFCTHIFLFIKINLWYCIAYLNKRELA